MSYLSCKSNNYFTKRTYDCGTFYKKIEASYQLTSLFSTMLDHPPVYKVWLYLNKKLKVFPLFPRKNLEILYLY